MHPGMARLLLLEDDVDSLEILELVLQGAGFDVVPMTNIKDARKQLERGVFDLVLADVMVGSASIADSWQLVTELAQLARPTRLGLITGWPLSAELISSLDLAFVIKKPCGRSELIAKLAATLDLPALTDGKRSLMHAYFQRLQDRAYQELGDLCTDDVVYQFPGTHPKFSNEIRGREAFLAFTHQTLEGFREPSFEVGAMRPLPNGAMVEYVGLWRDADASDALLAELEHDRTWQATHCIGVRVDPDQLG
jgi:CheY-like chemotaxis protein